MVARKAVFGGEGDGGLLGAGLAGGVAFLDGAPVVGSVVGPVGCDVAGVCRADFLSLDEVAVLETGVVGAAVDKAEGA